MLPEGIRAYSASQGMNHVLLQIARRSWAMKPRVGERLRRIAMELRVRLGAGQCLLEIVPRA